MYSHNTNTSGNIIKHNLRTSMNELTHFFIKDISHTVFSRKVWCFCGVWDIGGGGDRLLYWPNFSLDHSTLCYLQEPTKHFFCILAEVAQPRVTEGHDPQWGILSQQAALTQAFLFQTDSTATGICLYSFITPTFFRFFFRFFTQVHLWLMAQLRVNI